MNRCGLHHVSLVLVVAVLAGCSSPPPPRSAKEEISKAERCVESAKDWERKNEIDLALGEYKRAKEEVGKGRAFAQGSERDKLEYMEKDIRAVVTKLEMLKLTKLAEPEKPKLPPVAAVKTEDPEEKKRREEDEARKKREASEAKAEARIAEIAKTAAAPQTGAKKAKEDETDVAPEVGKKDKKDQGADKPAEPGAPAILKAEGPFPPMTEKSPPIKIYKLETKGRFAFVYVQIFNNAEAGKRIMNVIPFFKDANGQVMIDPKSTAVYPFSGFDPNAAQPMGGQKLEALTTGSHQITGFEGIRLVGVGEHDRAKDVKKVGIKVIYGDFSVQTDAWSGDAPADVPGLKALEEKK